MKLLIASDIHGSNYYMKLLLHRFKEEQADSLLLLGDYLYHGPRNPLTKDYDPSEVARLLNSVKDNVIGVRGNCDSEVDQMVLQFPMLGDYIQLVMDGCSFFLTHGHIDLKNIIETNRNIILLSGHTHIPFLHKDKNITYINPGSISLPKENHPNTYAIYNQGVFQIKTLEGKVYQEINLKSYVD